MTVGLVGLNPVHDRSPRRGPVERASHADAVPIRRARRGLRPTVSVLRHEPNRAFRAHEGVYSDKAALTLASHPDILFLDNSRALWQNSWAVNANDPKRVHYGKDHPWTQTR